MCGDVIGFEVAKVGTAGNIRRAPRPQQRSSGLLASSAAPTAGRGDGAAQARDDPFGDGRPSLFGGPDQFGDQFGDDGGGFGGGGGGGRFSTVIRQPNPNRDPNPNPNPNPNHDTAA